ncbi:GGDEF domain-containing protein [Acinetobacter indicus]|uniref:GGDEF domain-containing protein n=1 Tax=Acinetobacter indicus TaxID=756892 RepID=UPI000CECDE38|nr:GGDEF domain-containing protein [Acinetobacter indicus]
MLAENFSLYSALIPLFMMAFGSVILLLRLFQPIPTYFLWYAASTLCTGLTVLIITVVSAQVLPTFSFIPTTLLFISCAMFTHAIHLRLNVTTRWVFLLVLIAIAESIYVYFSVFDEQYAQRMLVLTITITLIFSHNLKALYQVKLKQKLDRLLRLSLLLLSAVIALRTLYLFVVLQPTNQILSNNLVAAGTQLIILCLSLLMAGLLFHSAYQDIFQQLQKERNLDPLTGLLNRRALEERLKRLKQHSRSKQNAIILCDLDFFKQINDQYGHKVGDVALQHVTEIISKAVRKYDEICRMGGEEFLILLQDTPPDIAIQVAERIRSSIETTPLIQSGQVISMTGSFGISFFQHFDEFSQAAQQADLLLYQAKNLGRNQLYWQQ